MPLFPPPKNSYGLWIWTSPGSPLETNQVGVVVSYEPFQPPMAPLVDQDNTKKALKPEHKGNLFKNIQYIHPNSNLFLFEREISDISIHGRII